MTNEEAIKIIASYNYYNIEDIPDKVDEAFDVAIKALKEKDRPQGEWIGQNKDCRGYCDSFKCSECGALIYSNCVQKECDFPSCPFCLADMRGEKE